MSIGSEITNESTFQSFSLTVVDRQRTNGPPTAVETIRIRRFVRAREKDLANISLSIAIEVKEVQICEKAITNLENAIPQGKKTLQSHEANLTSLIDIQTRLLVLREDGDLPMESEPHSLSLYDAMRNSGATTVSRSFTLVDEQIDILRQEVRELWDRVRDMEMELEGWKYSHKLSSTTLSDLLASKTHEETVLKGAKDSLKAIWIVPMEVWKSIFKMVVSSEMRDYLKQNNEMPLRSSALVLSRVCRSWRVAMKKEPELWSPITVHASYYWSQNKYDLLTNSVTKAGPVLSLLANLSQRLIWTHQGQHRHIQLHSSFSINTYVQPLTVDGDASVNGKTYSLTLDMTDDQAQFLQKAPSVPFRNPVALTLSARNPIRHNYLLSYLGSFSTTKSLTILNDNPQLLPSVNLASLLPQLASFTLRVKRLPPAFPIVNFLVPTLEELYLQHEDDPGLPALTTSVQLPKLHTLGVTFPASNFLERLGVPAIKKLILYGPSNSTGPAPLSDNFCRICNWVRNLQFEDWKGADVNGGIYGVAEAFDLLASKMPFLRSLAIMYSAVDGQTFVTSIRLALKEIDTGILDKLEEVTLSYTTGFTRDQCDELGQLVKKLKIHV